MDHLEKLHPHFYPQPIKIGGVDPDGVRRFEEIKSGYLTKRELLSLTSKSGDTLHRGSLKKLLSPRTPIERHFKDVGNWAQMMANLLSNHAISLYNGNEVIVCSLNTKGQKVRVAFAEALSGRPTSTPNTDPETQ